MEDKASSVELQEAPEPIASPAPGASSPFQEPGPGRALAVLALLLAHFAAGILASFASADQPAVSSAILIALVFCQTSLLGMWGGLGATHWLLRLLGVAVGTYYLYAVLGLGIDEMDFEVFFLVALATSLVVLMTWLVRLFKGVIRGNLGDGAEHMKEGLQFTIRHLMLLTLVVACLTALGKLLAPLARDLDLFARISVLGICYAAVALTSIWAILGLGHPLIRSIFVVLIALAAGVAGGYTIDRGSELGFWMGTTVLQAILLVASLYVLRKLGYRLMARTAVRSCSASRG